MDDQWGRSGDPQVPKLYGGLPFDFLLESSARPQGGFSTDIALTRIRAEMPADHKYEHAADGFSHGFKNPVPLAEVEAWRHNGKVRIGFSNGITRTFWLIANRAPAFPIEVHSLESAELLHRAVGFGPALICYETIFAAAQLPQTMMPKAAPADLVRERRAVNKV